MCKLAELCIKDDGKVLTVENIDEVMCAERIGFITIVKDNYFTSTML